MPEYYEPSGRTMPFATAIALALGIVAAIVLGFLYSVISNYVPFIKLRFLITIFFGLCVGGTINGLAYLTKIRSNITVLLLTMICSIVAIYSAWGTDVHSRTGFKEIPFALFFETYRPEILKEYIVAFYNEGLWTLDSKNEKNPETVKGLMLAGIWLIEAGCIIGFSIIFSGAFSKKSHRVFCEKCQCWMTHTPRVVRRSPEKTEELKNALLDGNPMPLINAIGPKNSDTSVLEVDLYTCPRCTETQYVTLNSTQYVYNSHSGNYDPKETALIKRMRIHANVVEALKLAPANDPNVDPGLENKLANS